MLLTGSLSQVESSPFSARTIVPIACGDANIVGRLVIPLERLEQFSQGMNELVKRLKDESIKRAADKAMKSAAAGGKT